MNLPDRLKPWAALIEANAAQFRLDPALVAALIERESEGRNVIGDNGHAVGLAQTDKRYHAIASTTDDRGRLVCLNPGISIAYACAMLRTLLDNFGGYTPAALCGYNAGEGAARKVLLRLPSTATLEQRVKALDAITAHGNYVSAVLAKRDEISA